jgi:hypothetical protein
MLISIINSSSKTATNKPLFITLYYQQWLVCSGSETATDNSFESLQMNFSVVVHPRY